MKIKHSIILLLLIVPIFANAQLWKRSRAEAYISGGATNFLGELGGANRIGTNGIRDFDFPATRPVFLAGYSYRFTKQTALQLELGYGFLNGNDKLTQEPFRQNRNLNFRTAIYQFDAKYCLTVSKQRPGHIYNLRGVRGMKNVQIISYVFAGVGLFWFNPKGFSETTGKWVALHPLSTEGQGLYPSRKNYHRLQPTIPVGFGFKWLITRDWMVGIEYTLHKTFTDYIDDVSTTYPNYNLLRSKKGQEAVDFSNPSLGLINSTEPNMQRGDPSDKDSYMFAVISLRYKIPYSRRFLGIPKF
ncbi:MAG: hypothetical protein WCK02_03525 [Bacteroidota bacterium]